MKNLTCILTILTCLTLGAQVNITFEVSTESIAADLSPDGIYLAGGSGFGSPGDNPMADPDGDGIYSITMQREVGFSSNYTFLNGNCPDWSCKENVAGLPCADPANFNDRFLPPVMEDITISTCFSQCTETSNCVLVTDSLDITFRVNTAALAEVSPDGIFLAGGGNFGSPGDNPMFDDDGDGIYELTLRKEAGFVSYYAYANGNCPDWSCKENLAGQPCGVPENFNDRLLEAGDTDLVVEDCFGVCDIMNCAIVTDSVDVTFMLNTATIDDISPDGIFIAGGGNFGVPGDNLMTDEGDGMYSFVTRRPVGFASFYTFLNGNCGDWSCKEDLEGLACGDPANFNDRFLPSLTEDTIVRACFGTCDSDGTCASAGIDSGIDNLLVDAQLFNLVPSVAAKYTEVQFGEHISNQNKLLTVYNAAGEVVFTERIGQESNYTISVDQFPNGYYFVNVVSSSSTMTKRFVRAF